MGFKIRGLDHPETKRGILSTVCSLFDPLGFGEPVAMAVRCLVQDLWEAKVGWDEPLGEEFLSTLGLSKAQLPSLSQLRIPRSYFVPDGNPRECTLELYVFSDASEAGYGASSYLRIEYPNDLIHCAFIMGKVRNTPVKFVSAPRVELQGVVLVTCDFYLNNRLFLSRNYRMIYNLMFLKQIFAREAKPRGKYASSPYCSPLNFLPRAS